MERLHSLSRRDGFPVALCYDCNRDGERLWVGLLLVRDGLKRRRLTFINPKTKEKIILELPKEAMKLKKASNTARIWLEVIEQ